MKISIIIPTYNHCEDLLKPLCNSIIQYTDLNDAEVLIVANGCIDNTREYVESLGSPFKLIWINEASGYTFSTNRGIEAATGEYIILLNNDCIILDQPKNTWINYLIEPLKNDSIGITGPLKALCPASKRLFMIFFCVAMRKSLLNKIGILDEIFSPGGCEDTDLCLRAEDAGYQLLQVPGDPLKYGDTFMSGIFPIWHKGEATVSGLSNWSDIVKRNYGILAERYDPNYIPPNDIEYLCKKFKTDKRKDMHNYSEKYERFFLPFKDKPINILEIGVSDNAKSLRVWDAYFTKAKNIVGLDINPNFKQYESGRIKIHIGPQADKNTLDELVAIYGKFDIIIDDGSHISQHQIYSFQHLFPYLTDNGVYAIEDLHTSYSNEFVQNHSINCLDYLKTLIGDLHLNGKNNGDINTVYGNKKKHYESLNNIDLSYYEKHIKGIHFFKNIAFIEKESW